MSAVGRSVDDTELVELLERRAARPKPDPALLERVTAALVGERQARRSAITPVVLSIGRARRAAAAFIAVAAAISLVGAALFVGGATRKAAEASPSASVAERSETRFTSVDFLRLLHDQPDSFIGHTVLVDGTLYEDQLYQCPEVGCPRHFGSSSTGDPAVAPLDAAATSSVGDNASGTFAIRVRSASDLRLLGRVVAPPAGDWWRPSELRETADSSLYAVDGWLVRGQFHPCPSIPASPGATPGPPFGCPDDEYLTDEPYQPVQPDGSERGPAHAAYLPAGTYASLGGSSTGHTVEPRHGVYLLRSAGCAGSCLARSTAWVALGTIDPVTLSIPSSPEPSSVAQREPTVLEEAALPAILRTLPGGTTILVRGTLVDTSGKSCHGDDCAVAGFDSIVDEVGVLAGGDMVTPASGTFAMRVVNATDVRYVDTVVPNGDHISWRPLELASYGPPSGTAYVVTGWLVPGDSSACPPAPDGSSGCDTRAPQLVEDEAAARQLATGQKVESLMLKSVGEAAEPTESGPAVYVVRAAQRTCNDLGGHAIPDCFVPPNAPVDLYVDARVDPLPPLTPTPPPSAPTSTSSPVPPPTAAVGDYGPGGIPREVGGETVNVGLDIRLATENATGDASFLIGGWYDTRYRPACSGGVGPFDPNPLGNRSCQWVMLEGGPQDLYFPPDFRAPSSDAPIVLRVHTHDPSADTCLPRDRDFCGTRLVADSVVWFGDDATRGEPIGPAAARRLVTNLPIAEGRRQPDGSIDGVSGNQFVTPQVCAVGGATGWPPDLFAIHGDPRLGLLAVFPNVAARERFQASHSPADAVACLGAPDEVVWAGEPSWVAHDNVLVLAFGDPSFNSTLADWLGNPDIDTHRLALPSAALDLGANTVWDYVEGRAFGALDAVWGYRLVDRDSAGWQRDVDRRARHTAVFGTISSVDEPITESTVGTRIWKLIRGTTDRRLFDVHYPGATDPALADERFLVIHTPNSTFVDWSVLRISGAPYPERSQ